MQNFKEHAKFYNLIYKDKPYEKEAKMVLRWAKHPSTILELGCGTGKHTEHFIKESKHIIAVDKSKEMIRQCKLNKKVTHFCTDVTPKFLKKIPKVDCATALFNVVGYICLENILPFLQLNNGGYFIFDCWDYDKVKVNSEEVRVKRFYGGLYRVSVPRHFNGMNFMLDFIIVNESKKAYVESHSIRMYNYAKIKEMCDLYGYTVKIIKSIEGEWTDWYCLQKI